MEGEREQPYPVEPILPEHGNEPPAYGIPQYTTSFGGEVTVEDLLSRIFLGLLLVFVAMIVNSITSFTESGTIEDALRMITLILRTVGILLVVWSLFQGALGFRVFTDQVRLGMLIAVGLIFAYF
jgi:hypothetical protein